LARDGQAISVIDLKSFSIANVVGAATNVVCLGIRKYQITAMLIGAVCMLGPVLVVFLLSALV
jgi:hypothetical protein